ncbi:multiple epidermal growth factor-like domains protein 6 [Haliotis asinina]|uniref:multiple epidermal growth factor-like domains protein 6 n=1 Tax=Haliotis asinina TaxID=109174 RepID=UPI003531FD6E
MPVFKAGALLAVIVAVRLPEFVLPEVRCKDSSNLCSAFAHQQCKYRPDGFKRLCKESCGICTREGCAYGYYGNDCLPCENLCLNGDESCGQREGPCAQNCTPGHSGRDCNSSCSTGCRDGECDKWSGFCIKGCHSGYYGHLCQRSCPPYCKGDNCERLRDVCADGCKSGWYGPRCFQRCPVHCLEGQCEDGKCTVGCEEGWWGSECKTPCPTHCNDNTCSSTTGMCVAGCKTGWHGDGCMSPCPANCQMGTCSTNNGNLTCTDGCNRGWFGLSCERKCRLCFDENCSQTGRCLTGCVRGRYGHSCNHVCPGGCVNNSCQQLPDGHNSTPGSITRRRAAGECLGECKEGLFGVFCNLTCTARCTGRDSAGECPGGCLEGHGDGATCNRSCECCGDAEGCPQNRTCSTVCAATEGCLVGSRVTSWITAGLSAGLIFGCGFIVYVRKRWVSGRQAETRSTYVSYHASLENLVIHDYEALEFGRDNRMAGNMQLQLQGDSQETVHADDIYLSCTAEPI